MKVITYVLVGIILSSTLAISCEEQRPAPTSPGPPVSRAELVAGLEEIVYLNKITSLGDMFGKSLGASEELIMDESLVWDDEWKASLAAEVAIRRAVLEELRQLEPPPRFTEYHRLTVEAHEEFVAADDLIIRAIDTRDSSLFDQAGERVKAGRQKLEEATDLMERIGGEP